MAISRKELMAYLQAIIEALSIENDDAQLFEPDVLAFVQWLLPIEEEREDEYQQAFKAILGNDPLWIPCMQCEYDGIFFDHVSAPRPTFLGEKDVYLGSRKYAFRNYSFKAVPGDRILVGKCQKCRITEHLHLPVIMHALAKRNKVMGGLDIPRYILDAADL